MPKPPLVLLALALYLSAPAQGIQHLADAPAIIVSPETRAIVQRIIGDTLVNGQAYEYDRQLSDEIGPRLTGSANYLKGVDWGVAKLRQLGLTNVHKETFITDTWEPGSGAGGEITAPFHHDLHLWSYGWSPSTPHGGIHGEAIYLPSLAPAELRAMASRITDHIVFFDSDSFPRPVTAKSHFEALSALRKLKPEAILVEGIQNGAEEASLLWLDGKIAPFPVAEVGAEDMALLRRLANSGPARVSFHFANRIATAVAVPQVIGEIRGSEKPDEVVIVGGHLDSWHPGTGAQDNGTGVATVVDTAREIVSLNRPPKRTVRFILFGGEEQGYTGSSSYVKHHTQETSAIDAILITDLGANTPHGWHLVGRTDERTALANIRPLLSGLGTDGVKDDPRYIFDSDHNPFNMEGVPSLLLWTSSYESVHHKASDTFDAVNRNTLLEGDATVIATVYAIADAPESFAPHLTRSQVEQMLKDANAWDDYQELKSFGILP